MIEKWGSASFYLSCSYLCTLYFFQTFFSEAEDSIHFSIPESRLWYSKDQNCEGCKDGGVYRNLWPIPSQVSFCALSLLSESNLSMPGG